MLLGETPAQALERHRPDRPATPAELAEARHYGVAAALCDRPQAPGIHPPLTALIGPVPVGQGRTTALMLAWSAGYRQVTDAAADALLAGIAS